MYGSSPCPERPPVLHVEALEERCLPSTAEYVAGLYNALLRRSPAPAEVAGWVGALHAGAVSPAEVARAFTTSSEYAADEIRVDYRRFLDRQPAPAEVANWLRPLEAVGEKQVEASFLASDEYFSRQGSDVSAWLNGVYRDVLGHAPDAAGFHMWRQAVQAGASRAAVALGIVDSPEADGRVVAAAYINLLGRQADPSGLTTWGAQLQQGLSPAGLAADIASSEEFIYLKAHGVLDRPCPSPAPVPPPDPATPEVEPSSDLFTTMPYSGVETNTADQSSCDGLGFDPGSESSICPPSPDSSTFDPGCDSSGFDPGCADGVSDTGADGGDGYY